MCALVEIESAAPLARATESLPAHKFEKGDSNRCRNAYERILHAELSSSALEPHKKNKHSAPLGEYRTRDLLGSLGLTTQEEQAQCAAGRTSNPGPAWIPRPCRVGSLRSLPRRCDATHSWRRAPLWQSLSAAAACSASNTKVTLRLEPSTEPSTAWIPCHARLCRPSHPLS